MRHTIRIFVRLIKRRYQKRRVLKRKPKPKKRYRRQRNSTSRYKRSKKRYQPRRQRLIKKFNHKVPKLYYTRTRLIKIVCLRMINSHSWYTIMRAVRGLIYRTRRFYTRYIFSFNSLPVRP